MNVPLQERSPDDNTSPPANVGRNKAANHAIHPPAFGAKERRAREQNRISDHPECPCTVQKENHSDEPCYHRARRKRCSLNPARFLSDQTAKRACGFWATHVYASKPVHMAPRDAMKIHRLPARRFLGALLLSKSARAMVTVFIFISLFSQTARTRLAAGIDRAVKNS